MKNDKKENWIEFKPKVKFENRNLKEEYIKHFYKIEGILVTIKSTDISSKQSKSV